MVGSAKVTFKLVSAAALLMASAYSYAVDCPGGTNFYHTATGSVSPITTTINVVVASNFKDPAEDLADDFVVGTSYQVNLCHGASGTIATSINGGNPYNLSLFMAADEGYAQDVADGSYGLGDIFLYAYGVPVWYLSPNAYASNNASAYFFTGQASGATAEGLTSKVVLKHSTGTPNAPTIAIGNIPNAPYGNAANVILGQMGLASTSYIYNAGTNVTSACSGLISGSQWQCMYSNIDNTLLAIENNAVTGGFVGWSQVCSKPTARYVKFPDYYTEQYGVLVDVASSAQETVAAAFVSFMNIGSVGWNSFLTTNCYKPI